VWGVAYVVILFIILAAVAAFVWLFVSYRQHLRDHRLAEHEHKHQPDAF
jgi:heme/copper-type cytochrome/quinol oxidase subunit 2